MSSTEMSRDVAPSQERAKRILIGFGITTLLGLTMAGWYVGGRILAIQKVHAAPKPKTVVATPAPSPLTAVPVPAPPVEESKHAGQRYLQLAALGPHSTKDYLKMLNSRGMHPIVAPGPEANLFRILIGPYPDKSALEKEQQALQTAGIEALVRIY